MTGTAFFYYVIGMTFSSIIILLTQVCYSKQNMKTPMIFGGIGVIINVVLNLLLIKPMAHGGLAFASSISAIFIASLLYLNLRNQYTEIKETHWHKKSIKIMVSAFISVGVSYLAYIFIILPLSAIIVARVAQVSLAVIIAGLVYLLLLYLLKIEELNLLLDIIKRKK